MLPPLFGADFQTWRSLQSELPPSALEAAEQLLAGIERFCIGVGCRHRAIVNYFDQQLGGSCSACDVCLGELDYVGEALIWRRKSSPACCGSTALRRRLHGRRADRLARAAHPGRRARSAQHLWHPGRA